MRIRSTKGVVVAATMAVGMLAVGGAGGAWAAAAPAHVSHGPGTRTPCAPTVSGTVSSVTTGSFDVTGSDGTVVTVDTTASTTYAETGAAVAPTGVTVGEHVEVTTVPGTSARATKVDAAHVLVVLTHVLGTVASVGPDSFTLELEGGLVVTVDTTASTRFRRAGVAQSGVAVGDAVTAYGAADPSDPSRLDAEFVVISAPSAAPAHPGPGSATAQLLAGTVSGAGAGGFTLTEAAGTVVTVTTTSTTVYGETGSSTAPAGVADGEQVRVEPVAGTAPTASAVTATRVVVVLTQVTGTVASVGTGAFAVQLFGGLVVTVVTDASTAVRQGSSVLTGVAVGQKVTAYGVADPSDPSELDAQFVDVDEPAASGGDAGGWTGSTGSSGSSGWTGWSGWTAPGHTGADPGGAGGSPEPHAFADGSVTSVTGDAVVVQERSGATVTVVVSSSTEYLGPSASSGLASVTVGSVVAAMGTPAGTGTLDALVLLVGGTPVPGGRGGRSGATAPATTTTTAPATATTTTTDPAWARGSTGSSGSGRWTPPTTTPTTVPTGTVGTGWTRPTPGQTGAGGAQAPGHGGTGAPGGRG